jgi:hypothetical protein
MRFYFEDDSPDEAQFLGTVMRRMCMGRAQKYPGGPNVLGSDGAHVREVPIRGADRKSCEIGHVAPAAGSWFSSVVTLTPHASRCRSVPFQDGSWAQEAIEGIFSRTCAISYPNFKFTFTVWMLAKAHKYLEARGALPL